MIFRSRCHRPGSCACTWMRVALPRVAPNSFRTCSRTLNQIALTFDSHLTSSCWRPICRHFLAMKILSLILSHPRLIWTHLDSSVAIKTEGGWPAPYYAPSVAFYSWSLPAGSRRARPLCSLGRRFICASPSAHACASCAPPRRALWVVATGPSARRRSLAFLLANLTYRWIIFGRRSNWPSSPAPQTCSICSRILSWHIQIRYHPILSRFWAFAVWWLNPWQISPSSLHFEFYY